MSTVLGGLPGQAQLLPLSGSQDVVTLGALGSTYDVTGAPGQPQVAQLIPSDITITAITARFSSVLATLADPTASLKAQLWTSSGGNILAPVPQVSCTLSLAPVLTPGSLASCSLSGLAITIPAGSVGMIVFSVSGGLTLTLLSGYMQASLAYNA